MAFGGGRFGKKKPKTGKRVFFLLKKGNIPRAWEFRFQKKKNNYGFGAQKKKPFFFLNPPKGRFRVEILPHFYWGGGGDKTFYGGLGVGVPPALCFWAIPPHRAFKISRRNWGPGINWGGPPPPPKKPGAGGGKKKKNYLGFFWGAFPPIGVFLFPGRGVGAQWQKTPFIGGAGGGGANFFFMPKGGGAK